MFVIRGPLQAAFWPYVLSFVLRTTPSHHHLIQVDFGTVFILGTDRFFPCYIQQANSSLLGCTPHSRPSNHRNEETRRPNME